MNTYMKSNIFCLGLLCALSLTACSGDSGVNQCGTTEEKNAFWNETSNLQSWNVMDGSGIKLDANKKTLSGRVSLAKASGDGLSRAGIVFDASDPDGSPVDLSEKSDGLCITYSSDFDVEVRLDENDYASSSLDKDLPYASFAMKDDANASHCVSWKEFQKKKSDLKDDSFVKKVRSVQIVFVGESGSSGKFDIQRLAPYVRWDMWFGKNGSNRVETGFDEGDEGTSGELTLFGDSADYIELNTHGYSSMEEVISMNEGYEGDVVFSKSSSNPDVGIQFLVAGKTTKKSKDVIYSADVSTKWKGICLEYESQMDIEMQLVPEKDSDALKMTFAKNNDMEMYCYEFDGLQNAEAVLKKLTKVRMKFVKKNKAGTHFDIRRISYLLPEDKAVRDVGEYKDVQPTTSSEYKTGKSFLWNGATDGDRVNTGIANAKSGGIWVNSAEENDYYSFGFPDDVNADDNGNFIPSLVSKYHKFTAYVKSDDGLVNLDKIPSIGFNTVSSKQEPADISAWGGFCIHYSTYNFIRIAVITDASANKYWYAEVKYSDDMVWGKVSWDAFKNVDKDSNEKIEDAIGKVTSVQLQFQVDGEFVVDKFGSYDQCGN